MNALVVIETLTPAIFSQEGGIDAMLSKLEADVLAIPTDVTTKAGRGAVASLAYQVSRSKTALDKLGKELGEDHYTSWKAITAERTRIEARLDALRDAVRKPLDDYEAAEAKRIADHQNALQAILDCGNFVVDLPASEEIVRALVDLESLPDRDWQEFKQKAAAARSETFAKLQALKAGAMAREAEAAELARLRAEELAREQQAHDERIATEAAAKATREAEAKADAERQRLDRERIEAVAAQRQAEAATRKAVEDAARDQRSLEEAAETNRLIAIDQERQRVADAAKAEADERERREADKAHRKEINNAAKRALVAAGLSEMDAIKAITAIVHGQVPAISISY